MDLTQLKAEFAALNVTFPDDFMAKRAVIYLEQVKLAFHAISPGGALSTALRGNYAKVKPALLRPNMLLGLCKILDKYIIASVNAELNANGEKYGVFCTALMAGAPGTVTAFLGKYRLTDQAILKILTHFIANIQLACERITNDWTTIQITFADNAFLNELIEIQTTGSDFHKGGEQVLLLTFSTQPAGGRAAAVPNLRVVYKPSDLEVDCLLIGNSAAVNRLRHPAFQAASLMEILNTLIAPPLVPFPTYKIMPLFPGSSLTPSGGKLPIRKSYGYLEFLSQDNPLQPQAKTNVIYPGNARLRAQICQQFYTLLGQLTAVSCVFSLSDLHLENLIVSDYLPYVIDLENTLSRPIERLDDTEMIGPSGAIDGAIQEHTTPHVTDTSTSIGVNARYKPEQNRLWDYPNKLIGTAEFSHQTLDGFGRMMTAIHGSLQGGNDPFAAWFTRLKQNHGAIVRIIPTGTANFQTAIEKVFSPENTSDAQTDATARMEAQLKRSYDSWSSNAHPDQVLPRFLCLQQPYVVPDIVNLDVPVFYHQLNTTEVLDSSGETVAVPNTITIGGAPKPVQVPLGRNTFFAHPPLDHIQNNQLLVLRDPSMLAAHIKLFGDRLNAAISSGKDLRMYNALIET